MVRYGFGDASGGGFGSSISDNVRGLEIQIGTWNEDGSGQTSNFREFGNFVIRLEKDASEESLEALKSFCSRTTQPLKQPFLMELLQARRSLSWY